jgi:SAM-dependent methyltransferase
MKNASTWEPSKFIFSAKKGSWVFNPAHVSPGSWYLVGLYVEAYEQTIQQYARGHLLDLGCGMVPFYGLYRDQVTDNTCIDWENSLHANPYLDVVADLNHPFPLSDNQYDVVLCTDVLEHIANPFAFMAETARVLAPNGHLLLTVPFFYWLHETPFDYYRYTEFALRKMCADNSLEVLSIQAYGGYLDVLLDLINKGIASQKWAIKLLLSLAKGFKKTGIYRRVRAKSEAKFPLGYVVVARKR